MHRYLCHINIQTAGSEGSYPGVYLIINVMWFGFLIFVCLSAEVLSYLTGGEDTDDISVGGKNSNKPETV